MKVNARQYPKTEELFNVISHGIGFLLSMAALILLVVFSSLKGTAWHVISFAIYGSSLVVLYLASTAFHLVQEQKMRNKLNILDHASIYLLIAGTYTPFALVTLNGPWGWTIFVMVWGIAITGIILKFFFIGRYNFLSTLLYIFMGWIILIAISPLVQSFQLEGIIWLLAGGLAYTFGAVFFLLKKIPYNHAIFHVFVLAGSICHFVAIFWYVLN